MLWVKIICHAGVQIRSDEDGDVLGTQEQGVRFLLNIVCIRHLHVRTYRLQIQNHLGATAVSQEKSVYANLAHINERSKKIFSIF